jgi:DNA primase
MAKIKEEDIDALRERADIVEIVSGYTRLKKAGANTFKGLCPFHQEKTPSFSVDSVKNVWHCFGCQAGGNIYHFVQKAENLPFPEAVEWVARKMGFPLRYEETRPGEQQRSGMKARMLDANREAADFFHDALMTLPEADEARRYLSGRGFGKEVAERWKLGFAPGSDKLCKHLLSKGFAREEIERSDLGRVSERDGSLYDTFRGRITFPTWNLQDDVVGFGARALGDQQPKYLNTAETPVFQKSRVMFGLNRAKSAIARGVAVVVEGYTDVILLHEAGIAEAVATNGVALGETHFELLKKFTDRAVLMLDADQAGRGATERSFGVHHRIGIEVLVAPLPAGRDPADVVSEDGAEGIRKAIDAARPLLEFKLEETLQKMPLDTPETRSRAVRAAAEVLGWHPDPIARHEYAFMVGERVGVDPEVIQRALADEAHTSEGVGGTSGADRGRLPGHVKVEREALRLLLLDTGTTARWVEDLQESDFTSGARRELFRAARASETSSARLAQTLSPDALALFSELTVGAETNSEAPADELLARLRVFGLERDIKARRDTLEKVNPLEEPERHDALFTELVALEARRRDLIKRLQGDR